MALEAPVAPKSFYENGLLGLKNSLEAVNGSTSGQIAFLSALPADIETAWATCGVGADSNVGTNVLGYAPIGSISDVVVGAEEGAGESGYKLQFGAVNNVPISITNTAIAIALLVGRDTFVGGSDADVRYIIDMNPDMVVTAGTSVNNPAFEIEIPFATNNAS